MAKYCFMWKNKGITRDAKDINDFIEEFERRKQILIKWKKKDVYLDLNSNVQDDNAIF